MRIETEIKQWGNSLALRISSPVAKEIQLEKGTQVIIDTAGGVLNIVRKEKPKRFVFPYSETQLLSGLTPEKAHADELASPQGKEVV